MKEKAFKSTIRLLIQGIVVIAVCAGGYMYMVSKQKDSLAKDADMRVKEALTGPVVKTVKAGAGLHDKGAVLIGEARPYESVTLYAKTSGYVSKIPVDKGQQVRQGQLLASVVSPEVDQAYRAAVADLENKKKILKRDETLLQKEYISKEDEEQSETNVKMAEAQVQSLKEQMAYKDIIAPFPGTVTARFVDPGALVQNATNSQTSAQPIVTLSELDKIRIYFYIAQADAGYLKVGFPVTITMTERPDVKIAATITRIAGELDPKTRMMLVEVDIPNKEQTIIPGSYVQVHVNAAATQNGLSIPSESLVIRGKNYFVAVIDKDSVLHYVPVTTGINDGTHVTILSGIKEGDLLGVNVTANISDGQKVRITQ